MRDSLTPGPETRVPRRQAHPSSGTQRAARAEKSVPLFGGAGQRGTEAPVFLRLEERFRSQRLRLHLPLRHHLPLRVGLLRYELLHLLKAHARPSDVAILADHDEIADPQAVQRLRDCFPNLLDLLDLLDLLNLLNLLDLLNLYLS